MNDAFYQEVSSYVESVISGTEARKIVALRDGWRFHDGEIQGAHESGFDDSSWEIISIPHDYSIEGEFSETYSESNGFVRSGIVWYRKTISLEKLPNQEKYYLMFDGVSMNSQVWINGRYLGQHPYAFTPFWYDVTPFIRFGKDAKNVVVVKADTSLQPFGRSYVGTGLFRNVWLISTYSLHIEQWGVVSKVNQLNHNYAEISVNTKVRVDRYPETIWNAFRWQPGGLEHNNEIEKTVTLVTSILDACDNVVVESQEPYTMVQFSKHEFSQVLTVREPRQWSPEDPYMYRLHSKLFIDGEMVDDTITPLGIRTISYDSRNGFLLNGVGTKLKGVCMHQDSGIHGGAVPVQEWAKRLQILKEAGCNAIRTAHHPFATEFYHICDYLGLMVMDEAFDEWQSGWTRGYLETPYGKNTYGYSLYFNQWHDTDLRAMVRRDRNHPCVIMWSVGNEIPELYFEEGIGILKSLVKICHEEDTTRPVTVCAEGDHILRVHDGIMDQVDIAGYNYVNIREGADMYDRIHQEHPEWVLVGSETQYEPEHWKAVKEHQYVIGQFLWVGYDYLGEGMDILGEDSDVGRTYDMATIAEGKAEKRKRILRCGFAYGLVDTIDTPRGEYFYRKSVWSKTPFVCLAVKHEMQGSRKPYIYYRADMHWNWSIGEKKTVLCFTNCEQVELILNGQSLGIREVDKDSAVALEWDVEYTPGCLKAIGYNQNVRVSEHTLITASSPSRLVLKTDRSVMKAGEGDYADIYISVVDENGTIVPNATNRVSVSVKGSASLLGVISADMTSNESYRADQCKTFKGRCKAVLRSGKEPGPIMICVRGEGLTAACLQLECKVLVAKQYPMGD